MEKTKNKTPPPRPDDDELRSIMLERLSIAAARGGLEMEEKLKSRFVGLDIPSCSFVFPKGRDHHIYKQKIAEYTKSPPLHSPPPLPPGLVDQCCLKYNPLEQVAIIDELSAFTVRVPEGGMTRKELGIIKFTAQFVLRYGQYFRLALRDRVSTDTEFKFLDKGDSRAHFFSLLFLGYSHLLRAWEYPLVGMDVLVDGFLSALNSFKEKLEGDEELVDKIKTDRHDFVVCDEYFADLENKALELKLKTMARMHHPLNKHDSQGTLRVPPVLVLFRVGIPQGGMMRKELGLMKFTAMFVVRYGNDFWDALWDRVSSTETEFQFLKRNPGNDRGMLLFSQLLLAFGNVVQPWGLCPRESNPPARMEAVLEGFFTAFSAFKKKQEDEEDEVVNKLVTDRRDFVVSETFQYFLDIEESTPLPERLPLRQTGSMFARRHPMVQQPPLL
ncbi:SWAP (Suppressor-of-White-APricot)/surp domain-containing protein [Arabidopsis thaliana]|uniref:At2g43960 n=3 Tax=Arabidopsis TaxID=3701 RepID=Q58FX2_ARATH|nr:SWAP (Suppressor-of-White-APricot)/surp domain-containing protein [Arabidopsis thaliana]AAX55163.1 hypothetical protein At2g43960 [Arabidopsis thaliana]ABI93884.1 At2g43960 [Arabidopsis thaliana]AEC10355.1 SWAP (Suppressor-of-White-APricot)/surp domain-containing protein [Arabidopsis thaliana]|eukprot:NP_181924.2 SWAP (Suppressor-of-White-APricot)/surp domain-containing protein [Arabidopsis thaliana]